MSAIPGAKVVRILKIVMIASFFTSLIFGQALAVSPSELVGISAAKDAILNKVLSDVLAAFGDPDSMQMLLRRYGRSGLDLARLNQEILTENRGQPMKFFVNANPHEIEVSNRILAESGFLCFQFVNDSQLPPRSQGPAEDSRLIRAGRFVEPGLLFGVALMAGIIQVKLQQAAAIEAGKPAGDFAAQLRPFIGMGISGAVVRWQFLEFHEWWKRRFWDPRTSSWKFEMSISSMKDGIRRLIRPRGIYAESLGGIAGPFMMALTASSVAAYPGNPVLYDAPSPIKFLFLMTLYGLSHGATHLALRALEHQGNINPTNAQIGDSVSRWLNSSALTASLVNGTALGGALFQSLFAVAVSARLQIKQRMGDPLFRRRTANLLNPTAHPMSPHQILCAAIVSFLSPGLRETRRLP